MKTRVDIEVNGEKIIDQLKSESSTLRELVGLKQNRLTSSSEGNENLLTQPTEEGGDPGIIKRSVLAEDIINQIKNSEISKINSDISRIESSLSVLETTDSEIKNDLSLEVNRAALEENSLRSSILEESTRAQTTENSLDDRTLALEENFDVILGEIENSESKLSKAGLANLPQRLETIEEGVYIWVEPESYPRAIADSTTRKITFTGLDKLAYSYEMSINFTKSYFTNAAAWKKTWSRNLIFSINQTEIKWNFRAEGVLIDETTEVVGTEIYGSLGLSLYDNDSGSKTLEITFPEKLYVDEAGEYSDISFPDTYGVDVIELKVLRNVLETTHTSKFTELDNRLEKEIVAREETDENLAEVSNKLDTFLTGADVSTKAIDTLKEIQEYIDKDENLATEILGNISEIKETLNTKQNQLTLSGDTGWKDLTSYWGGKTWSYLGNSLSVTPGKTYLIQYSIKVKANSVTQIGDRMSIRSTLDNSSGISFPISPDQDSLATFSEILTIPSGYYEAQFQLWSDRVYGEGSNPQLSISTRIRKIEL